MINQRQRKWDVRFLNLAYEISWWSKDPSTKVGCVIVEPKGKTILATGYNGLPRNITDSNNRLEDRTWKYLATAHAEVNAIYSSARNGVSVLGSHLYSTWFPCSGDPAGRFSSCVVAIIQSGISRVIVPAISPEDRWKVSMEFGVNLLKEAGVELVKIPPSDLKQPGF